MTTTTTPNLVGLAEAISTLPADERAALTLALQSEWTLPGTVEAEPRYTVSVFALTAEIRACTTGDLLALNTLLQTAAQPPEASPAGSREPRRPRPSGGSAAAQA